MKIKDVMKVTSKNQFSIVWLNNDEFLTVCNCELCNKKGLTIENNDDGKNFLGMSICLNH